MDQVLLSSVGCVRQGNVAQMVRDARQAARSDCLDGASSPMEGGGCSGGRPSPHSVFRYSIRS